MGGLALLSAATGVILLGLYHRNGSPTLSVVEVRPAAFPPPLVRGTGRPTAMPDARHSSFPAPPARRGSPAGHSGPHPPNHSVQAPVLQVALGCLAVTAVATAVLQRLRRVLPQAGLGPSQEWSVLTVHDIPRKTDWRRMMAAEPEGYDEDLLTQVVALEELAARQRTHPGEAEDAVAEDYHIPQSIADLQPPAFIPEDEYKAKPMVPEPEPPVAAAGSPAQSHETLVLGPVPPVPQPISEAQIPESDKIEEGVPLLKAFRDFTQQAQEALKEGLERDRKARDAFSEKINEAVKEHASTDLVLVRNSAQTFYELALQAQTTANDTLGPLFKALSDNMGAPLKELEDIIPLPLITWYSLQTKGYAGDISPRRASRILRQRSDAVLLDVRDLRQVHGEDGARGIPDLRLGARGKGVMVSQFMGDAAEAKEGRDASVIDVHQAAHDAPEVHVVGATEETVVVILEEDAPPAPAVDPTGSSSSSGSPGAAGPWDGGAGALAVRDRRAALAHQSAVIAGMQQVSQGKLVIILDQDGMDAAELAKLLRTNGIERPYVVKGGYEGWVENGLRTKDGDEYRDPSPWQVFAEELEALVEDTENIFDAARELSRTDTGKVALVSVTGITAWAILYNVKLAFELFVCAIVLDQIGSSWDRQPVSIWVKMQRIQQRFSQFAVVSMQVERLRSELADVYGKVKEREKENRIAHAKGPVPAKGRKAQLKVPEKDEKQLEQERIELLKEEIRLMSEREGTLLGELRTFLASTAGKSQAALAVGLGGLVVTHTDELFNGAVALLFIKVILDRVTTRAEKKENPLFVQFEKMLQKERDNRVKKLTA
eukprot:EG_transcript_1999